MKRCLLGLGPLGLAVLLSGCVVGADFGSAFKATVDESRPLSPTGELSLENVNGSVRVAAWDEARVRIEATKRAGSERALEELEVEITGEGDRVAVRTRHPRPRFLGGGGSVEYRVSVPRGARVHVKNVNGRVEVDGVAAAVEAATVNGSVEVAGAAGEVRASAVNGSVEAVLARVDAAGRSRLSTTNGSVRLTLPSDASAEIEGSTVNGSVGVDFELADGRKSRRKVEGRIGQGGARFELSTVNGSVHVDRGLSSAAARPPTEAPSAPEASPAAR